MDERPFDAESAGTVHENRSSTRRHPVSRQQRQQSEGSPAQLGAERASVAGGLQEQGPMHLHRATDFISQALPCWMSSTVVKGWAVRSLKDLTHY
jgi:hypothetical protein